MMKGLLLMTIVLSVYFLADGASIEEFLKREVVESEGTQPLECPICYSRKSKEDCDANYETHLCKENDDRCTSLHMWQYIEEGATIKNRTDVFTTSCQDQAKYAFSLRLCQYANNNNNIYSIIRRGCEIQCDGEGCEL